MALKRRHESETESERTVHAMDASDPNRNRLMPQDSAAHDWYRFVLSFPPHLVRDYLKRFGVSPSQQVLDPFCGTGTTLVECKKLGIQSIGVEANPMAAFASQVKTDWSITPDKLLESADRIANRAAECIALSLSGHSPPELRSLPDVQMRLLLKNSISPLPMHKAIVLLESIRNDPSNGLRDHQLLAFSKALVSAMSNLRFGPEVGVGKPKTDCEAVTAWREEVDRIALDLRGLADRRGVRCEVHRADARRILDVMELGTIEAVVTSPPYPNEKDYTRTTRLESVLLGFITCLEDLRHLKRTMIRSNTRGVYKGDDDDSAVEDHRGIQRIAEDIERRRVQLGKTSGFERLYARVTKLYFGGMKRHLADLRLLLKRGAKLAYVVGDQASYLRVPIRTGQLLAGIAESLGYRVESIDLFRTRLSTATKQQLREEVVVLSWCGDRRGES